MQSDATLESLGWSDFFESRFTVHRDRGLIPGRISRQHKGSYSAITEAGEIHAVVTGRMRFEASGPADLPVVGDWVALDAAARDVTATITAIIERRTKFSRKVAGFEYDEQILVTNVDVVFVVSSLDNDINPRRLERYLTVAYSNGAMPVVVLTKADVCEDVSAALAEVNAVAAGTSIHVVSAVTGAGFSELQTYLGGNRTVALLGSSGVGKSTIVNQLAGRQVLEVQEVRESDQRGRHTTTHRQMVLLHGGGVIVDTPGMRELQLWDATKGLSGSFHDIDELARSCRFRDCRHNSEPGCAVRAAVDSTVLTSERLASYVKLQRELFYLEKKVDQRLAQQETRNWKIQHKAMRKAKSPKV